jgi:hypothetical protein
LRVAIDVKVAGAGCAFVVDLHSGFEERDGFGVVTRPDGYAGLSDNHKRPFVGTARRGINVPPEPGDGLLGAEISSRERTAIDDGAVAMVEAAENRCSVYEEA